MPRYDGRGPYGPGPGRGLGSCGRGERCGPEGMSGERMHRHWTVHHDELFERLDRMEERIGRLEK